MTTPDRLRTTTLLIGLAALLCCLAVAPSVHSYQRDKKLRKDYALIFGTVWDKQNRAVQGASIRIRREGDKKPRWELISDRNGEFAQRVPPGKMDYVVWVADTRNVVGSTVLRRKLKPGQVETKVHIDNDERTDISVHLTE